MVLLIAPIAYHFHYQYTHFIKYNRNSIKIDETIKIDAVLDELENDLNERNISEFHSALDYLDDFVKKKDIPLSKAIVVISLASERYSIGFGFVIGIYQYMFYIRLDYETNKIIEFDRMTREIVYPSLTNVEKIPIGYTINEEYKIFTARMRMSSFYRLINWHGEKNIYELQEILIKKLDYVERNDFY